LARFIVLSLYRTMAACWRCLDSNDSMHLTAISNAIPLSNLLLPDARSGSAIVVQLNKFAICRAAIYAEHSRSYSLWSPSIYFGTQAWIMNWALRLKASVTAALPTSQWPIFSQALASYFLPLPGREQLMHRILLPEIHWPEGRLRQLRCRRYPY